MFDAFSYASFLTGLTLSASLIVAIGAQNAFVLRQGLRREHVTAVVGACTLLDIALMVAGVVGLGAAIADHRHALNAATLGGALVLAWYGLAAFRRSLSPHGLLAQPSAAAQSAGSAIWQVLSISLLNPHVYLDTVVLVGTVGAKQASGTQGAFLLGSCLASSLWFAALGFGARALSPLFARPVAWRVLDGAVGATMWWIAAQLVWGTVSA